jgi:NitT/TauT family transport system substrate-binding protein
MNLYSVVRWIGAGVLAAGISCGSSVAATKIKLGYSAAAAFANAFVAADEGIFARHGLDVELILVPNSSTTPAALVSDSLQVATPTAPVTLQAIEAGLDLVVLSGGAVTVRGSTEVAVLAHEGSGIKTAKDFEGKKIATPGLNGFLHVLFREWMTQQGADWKKVTFVETPFAQLNDVLKAGQVDGIVTADPFKTRAVASNAGYVVAHYVSDIGDGVTGGWFIASRRWADQNKDAAKAFQVAMKEATEVAMSNPEVLRKAIASHIKMPPEVLAQLTMPKLEASVSPEQIDFWSKVCVKQGLTRKPTDPARILWK